MAEMRIACKILVKYSERKISLGRLMHGFEDNIEIEEVFGEQSTNSRLLCFSVLAGRTSLIAARGGDDSYCGPNFHLRLLLLPPGNCASHRPY
jgi:hypothetical protein